MKSTNSQIKLKKMGRPSKVKLIDLEQLKFLVLKGCTDEEICQFFKINRSTFWRYQQTNPELCNTIKGWKNEADVRVERTLFESAVGYSHESEEIFCSSGKVTRVKTVKQYAPNVLACIFWLKNRKPEQWREKQPEPEDEELKDSLLTFASVPTKNGKLEEKYARFINP
jgi:hypothetical protein